MIPQSNISRISNRTTANGKKRVPEAVIEKDYCLSWFLFGLANSPLREILIFKGGTALRRCYFEDYRFSEDLDFSLRTKISQEEIINALPRVFQYIKDENGLEFSFIKSELPSENTYTFYLGYKGPIPSRDVKQIKVDITFHEIILFDVKDMPILKTYDEYSDFPSQASVVTYALDEIATEKVCALFSKNRNEPRDLFDIYCLINDKNIVIADIKDEILKKMEFKGSSFSDRLGEFEKKEKNLAKAWVSRLSDQVSELPEFEDVYRSVKKAFRSADLL